MTSLLTVVFALAAAASNASAMVLQRMAARTLPQGDAFSIRLMRDLIRHRTWLAGIMAVICAAVFQALALTVGSLALVQPIFVIELPFALVIGGFAFRRRLGADGWAAIGAVTLGIAAALVAAAPSGGRDRAAPTAWAVSLAVTLVTLAVCVLAALPRPRGKARAALFGAAAAIGYALTAALMKTATDAFSDHGPAAFFTTWQTYAFAAAGAGSVFLLSNAVESGPLTGSQPALTLGDATVSLALGLLLYGEHVRTGWWLIPEALGVLLVITGVMTLPRVESRALAPPGAPGSEAVSPAP